MTRVGIFAFIIFFRSFCRITPGTELLQEEIIRIHGQAGDYCLEQGFTEKALNYYVKANDINTVEKILGREGTEPLRQKQAGDTEVQLYPRILREG